MGPRVTIHDAKARPRNRCNHLLRTRLVLSTKTRPSYTTGTEAEVNQNTPCPGLLNRAYPLPLAMPRANFPKMDLCFSDPYLLMSPMVATFSEPPPWFAPSLVLFIGRLDMGGREPLGTCWSRAFYPEIFRSQTSLMQGLPEASIQASSGPILPTPTNQQAVATQFPKPES